MRTNPSTGIPTQANRAKCSLKGFSGSSTKGTLRGWIDRWAGPSVESTRSARRGGWCAVIPTQRESGT
jgi:hypothetical protein